MKILIVTNMYPTAQKPFYGIFVKEQVEALKRRYPDLEFDIFVINGDASKLQYLKSIPRIRKKIKQGGYDLVHVHYGLSGMFLLFGKLKVPVVMSLHGGDIQIAQKLWAQVAITKRALRLAQAAFTLNHSMDQLVARYCPRHILCPCGVDVDTFHPRENVQRPSRPIIVFPSDPARWVKNYPLFCATVDILRQKYHLDVEERHVKGLTRPEVNDLFNQASLLLLTSHSEGSPQVVKEAMACNLPVVTVPVGDVKVTLQGVENSPVASQASPEELAALCAQIIQRDARSNGRQRILDLELDAGSIASKIRSVYDQLTPNFH
ncbi:MAG: glycosyltransferase [Bacteroidales bacterium]|nr:glycosyltransferase [Bacteroidales bacterium]